MRYESLEGGGYGVPWLLAAFGALLAVILLLFGNFFSAKKETVVAPPAVGDSAGIKAQVLADRKKRLYYLHGCGEADAIPDKDKVTFPSEVEASKAGYKASACP